MRQVSNEPIFEIIWRVPFTMVSYLEAQARRYVGEKGIERQNNPANVKKVLEMIKNKVKNNG